MAIFSNLSHMKEIFDKMEYGFEDESYLYKKWIKSNIVWIENTVRACGRSANFSDDKLSFNLLNSESLVTRVNESNSVNSRTEDGQWFTFNTFDRVRVFTKLSSLLERNSLLMAQLCAFTCNVPICDVMAHDIPYIVKYFEYCSFQSMESLSVKQKSDSTNNAQITGLIPLYEICWKVGPSLICGHSVKLTVDENAILITMLFMSLCFEAGVPEQAIKVESIKQLLTGEYSGQSVAIIYSNADIRSAIGSVIDGAWGYNGLAPWSIKRVLVQEPIYEEFISKLLKQINESQFGSALSKYPVISKLSNNDTSKNLETIITQAKSEGLEVHQVSNWNKEFINPTVIAGRPQCLFENPVVVPVITVETFRTVEESVNLVKNSRFYASASLWTDSQSVLRKAWTLIVNNTNVHNIWLNASGILEPNVPFVIQDVAHSVKEDLFLYIFHNAFPEIGVLDYNPETPTVLLRIEDSFNVRVIDDILEKAAKAADVWFKIKPAKCPSVLSVAAVELLDYLKPTTDCCDGTTDALNSLANFMLSVSSSLQNLQNESIFKTAGDVISITSKRKGVVLFEVHSVKNIYILLHIIVLFIASGNSLILLVEEENKTIIAFHECLKKGGLPVNVITTLKAKIKSSNVPFKSQTLEASNVEVLLRQKFSF